MPLVVEDGSGLANANSYCSVADATTYHADRGNSDWAALASDTIREQLLVKATDHMVRAYRTAWAGSRKTSTQKLDWPRVWVPYPDLSVRYATSYYPAGYFPDNAVPDDVKFACAELALKAAAGPLMPDIERLTKSESVGPLSVTYADNDAKQYPIYSDVQNMLDAWLSTTGNQILRA